ncbi:serine hydrolase domain-containing protein [Zavarzinia sp. CC-PAN008]|uniref:serine hydrolase domain-containing protein n=1 Tax=Zavarzinia sp. CC-PAN008 TaxID=3243332 RepID=UPI003F74A64A
MRGRFAAVQEGLAAQVVPERLPGAVWLVDHRGAVSAGAVGTRAIGSAEPMARDAIFRIASMTKPVTSAAVLILVEEGRLDLNAPVERWLPELANRRVLRRPEGPLDETEPAHRPITVRQLLDFTFGFGIQFGPPTPVHQQAEALGLVLAQPVPMTTHEPDDWLARFATLPLMHQPGERWLYNVGSLIQGVLVRRVARQDFDTFVHERILQPLGLRDTGFHVPAAKLHRLAGCGLFAGPSGQDVKADGDGADSAYARPPVFPSGTGGLVSTADDYLVFARMLAAGGLHGDRRILSADSVRLMTTNQLSADQIARSSFFPGFFDTLGWGLGTAVARKADDLWPGTGRHGWDGGFGTSWITDPNAGVISIVLTQSTDFLFAGGLHRHLQAVAAATR